MTTIKNEKGLIDCSMDDLLFPVEIIDNPIKTNSEYSKIVKGIINNEDFHLNYCSPRYELVKNVDIFPEIEKVLNQNNIEYNVCYKHLDNVRFYADYTITDKTFAYNMNKLGGNDSIQPMLKVQHSYNGLTNYKIIFGYFRLACSNGLTIPVKEMNEYNLSITGKHTINIKHSFEKLNQMLNHFITNQDIIKSITNKYDLLGGHWIEDPKDRIIEVLNKNKISIIDTKVNDILNRVRAEANNPNLGYDGQINDWLIYNGINSHINDNTINIASPEARMKDDSNVLESMLMELSLS